VSERRRRSAVVSRAYNGSLDECDDNLGDHSACFCAVAGVAAIANSAGEFAEWLSPPSLCSRPSDVHSGRARRLRRSRQHFERDLRRVLGRPAAGLHLLEQGGRRRRRRPGQQDDEEEREAIQGEYRILETREGVGLGSQVRTGGARLLLHTNAKAATESQIHVKWSISLLSADLAVRRHGGIQQADVVEGPPGQALVPPGRSAGGRVARGRLRLPAGVLAASGGHGARHQRHRAGRGQRSSR